MKTLFEEAFSRQLTAVSQKPPRYSLFTLSKIKCQPRDAAGKLASPESTARKSPSLHRAALAVATQPLPRLDTNGAPRHSVGGGGERNRTDDLLLAKQALSQLSYTPANSGSARVCRATTLRRRRKVVGQGGFEPPTSRLSSARSNQLSY
jgi:hypothetical protein